MVERAEEVRLRAVEGELGGRDDLRADFVLEPVDLDVVAQSRAARGAWGAEEGLAEGDEEEGEAAGAGGGGSGAREGEGDVAVGGAGEPFEAVEGVVGAVGAGGVR